MPTGGHRPLARDRPDNAQHRQNLRALGRPEPALSPRRIPLPQSQSRPVLDQNERLRLLRETLDNNHIPLHHRAAAVMLLLYAQPLTRIASMRRDQISRTDDGETLVVFEDQPVPVPHPFDQILQQHLADRPNMNTAANRASP